MNMERNQNGYPTPHTAEKPVADGCGKDGITTMDDLPLGYAYVPIQKWRMLYSPEDALVRGTMFEELDKPTEVYGNEW